MEDQFEGNMKDFIAKDFNMKDFQRSPSSCPAIFLSGQM